MSSREQAIEAAGRQILRDQGYEPRDDRPIGTAWLKAGESIVDAIDVPGLFNDLADRIEAERDPDDEIDDWNIALIKAAEIVRAAAEGWGQANG